MPDAPSPWIVRWASAITPHGTVLDLAMRLGTPRALPLLRAVCAVTAVDRDRDALAPLARSGSRSDRSRSSKRGAVAACLGDASTR